MPSIPTPLGGGSQPEFDAYDAFVPEHLPEPGPFLQEHDLLVGREHAAVHRLAHRLFEERGVYDMTFGYNLARLNLDPRHEDAGFRYAKQRGGLPDAAIAGEHGDGDPLVLRAEFTPTTKFCPQSHTLTTGSFRAWNAEPDRHEFDVVSIRVASMHQRSDAINEALTELESKYIEAGPSAIVNARATEGDADLDPTARPAAGGLSGDGAPF